MRVSYEVGTPAGHPGSFGLAEPSPRAPTRRRRRERRFFGDFGWKALANDTESAIGLAFVALFTTGLTFFMLLKNLLLATAEHHRFPIADLVALWIGWGTVAVIQVRSFHFVAVAFGEARRPRPVNVALRQRFRWSWLRKLAGIWWIFNALGLLLTGEWILSFLRENLSVWDQKSWLFQAAVFVIFFGCSYAANTFILLAAATYSRRRHTLLVVWRLRVVLDVACAMFAVTANYFLHLPLQFY